MTSPGVAIRTCSETRLRWNSCWRESRLTSVSLLLGHGSIKITERHYAPFVKARQQQLETSARLAWEPVPQAPQQPERGM